MRTLLINASPRIEKSNSGFFLNLLGSRLAGEFDHAELHGAKVPAEVRQKMAASDRWVFLMPLYVDGLPSHLLACLLELYEYGQDLGPAGVFGVVNCGFQEGRQAQWALEVLENWTQAMGLQYGGGLGIGAGEAAQAVPSPEKGPLGPVLKELQHLAGRIEATKVAPVTAFTAVALPRFFYKMAADSGWRRQIRKNGGRVKDLGRRRTPPKTD